MHTSTAAGTKTVAIIGGGVSGALTAFHLRRSSKDVRIAVVDPRPELGLGLAYSNPSLGHLLNVPAGKISALPNDAEHFLRWFRANHDAEATPMTFAPRAVFGRYIRSLLTQEAHIEHLQTAVTDMTVTDSSASGAGADAGQICDRAAASSSWGTRRRWGAPRVRNRLDARSSILSLIACLAIT